MSGELINSSLYYKQKNIFKNGAGNFSSGSINDLFDVNGDGETSGVEKDRMEDETAYNILESIHPAVARAFQDDTFNIQQGNFLTQSQQFKKLKYELIIERELLKNRLEEEKSERVDKPELDEPNILINEEQVDNTDLAEDIIKRQYLTMGEIDNGV